MHIYDELNKTKEDQEFRRERGRPLFLSDTALIPPLWQAREDPGMCDSRKCVQRGRFRHGSFVKSIFSLDSVEGPKAPRGWLHGPSCGC